MWTRVTSWTWGPNRRLEPFCDLHRVERSALEELVTGDPKSEAVIKGAVVPKPAYLAVVAFRTVQRQRVLGILGIIDDIDAFGGRQSLACLDEIDRPLKLGIHRDGVGA